MLRLGAGGGGGDYISVFKLVKIFRGSENIVCGTVSSEDLPLALKRTFNLWLCAAMVLVWESD